MTEPITFKDRVRYAMDNIFSRGVGAMIAALAVLSLAVIVFAALVLSAAGIAQPGDEPLTFSEAAWESLMRTLDAGTMGGDTGWAFRLVMFAVTLGGVFVISTLIGILTSGVESKLDELRKGRSRVLESNHTVILGWSAQLFTIVPELVEANSNQPGACIVILGDEDKIVMEDTLREQIGSTGKTRLVCRRGKPMEMADLNIVNLNTARSIIVLSPDSDDPDAEVLKTVLAITNNPNRREGPYHIVAELRDEKNADIARVVGRDEVEWVQVGDVVARVIAQTCRQSGLSVVYTELLDFGGDEIYFFNHPSLAGKAFGETLNRFEKNTVLGLAPAGGAPQLNPPMDTVIGPQDRLIVLSADDDQIFLNGQQPAPIRPELFTNGERQTLKPERTLVLGWNWRGPSIVRELDAYVAPGSDVVVLADIDGIEEKIGAGGLALVNQSVTVRQGDTTDRRTLEALNLHSFHHIIILCYSDLLDIQRADSRTLITLLHIRDMAERSNKNFSIVSEMLDVRNRNLADVTRADDFIVSDRLISLIMAQVSENKDLNAVFRDLFDPQGAEIYLKPAHEYVKTGVPVNFYTLVEAARCRGELAIGYRLHDRAQDASRSYGVVLNPAHSVEVSFTPQDKVIVIAND